MEPCYEVYSNNQKGMKIGKEDGYCHTAHRISSRDVRHGKIVHAQCDVRMHFYRPQFNEDPTTGKKTSSSNQVAIICYGEHSHPPPPPKRISDTIKTQLLEAIAVFGVEDATARRLIASRMLPQILDGATTLAQHHPSLINTASVNRLIRQERIRQFP
jgi:hypothetical protein